MAEQFANKIKRLELENFTCFGKMAMDFSPGINVIIGENGTGKTHLLKVMYYFTDNFPNRNLWDVFKVEKVSSLSRDIKIDAKGKVDWNGFERKFTIESRVSGDEFKHLGESKSEGSHKKISESIFLPPQEMLSWFKGFISSYENRESYIDEVFYKLAKAIDPLSHKGEALERQEPLLKDLEKAIRAKVIRKGDDFFLSFIDEQKQYPSQLVATGINKLAQLIYLIMNGSLTKDTILFWDEPEANLNPKYILVVSKFLQTMAKAGCQIFVATHDYLLLNELSMAKQFKEVENSVPDMKFFSLVKGENGTEVQEGGLITEIQDNPVLDAYVRHHETQMGLYTKQLQTA